MRKRSTRAWARRAVAAAMLAASFFIGVSAAAALPARADYRAASSVTSFTYEGMKIPAYDGDSYENVNGGDPDFTKAELKKAKKTYQTYSSLDSMGRCGAATASLNISLMPRYTRGSISNITPSGWVQDRYDIVPGRYLYNRCHLIGFQLTGIDCTHRMKSYAGKDLITGTRYMNVGSGSDGMVGFENEVADYLKRNPNFHVLYRVTPVYRNRDDLVVSGVLMEAESVETKTISYCVYCYNVQPGIAIDYETGMSRLDGTVGTTRPAPGKCEIKSLRTEQQCYVTKSGRKYHFRAACTGRPVTAISFARAKAGGYELCRRCAKSRSITVSYDSIAGATGYDVSYRIGSGRWTTVRSTSCRAKTVKNVKAGYTYTVKVRAVRSGEAGRYGAEKRINVR